MGLCWCDSGTGILLCYGFGTGIWQAYESTPLAVQVIAVNRHQSSISSLESLSTSKYPQLIGKGPDLLLPVPCEKYSYVQCTRGDSAGGRRGPCEPATAAPVTLTLLCEPNWWQLAGPVARLLAGRACHGASLPSSAARNVRSALSASAACHQTVQTGTSCQWQHPG